MNDHEKARSDVYLLRDGATVSQKLACDRLFYYIRRNEARVSLNDVSAVARLVEEDRREAKARWFLAKVLDSLDEVAQNEPEQRWTTLEMAQTLSYCLEILHGEDDLPWEPVEALAAAYGESKEPK